MVYEVYDVLDLMPRAHGFPSREIFKANFYPGGRGRPRLAEPYADRLVRFLLPNVVARPSDVLTLPPHEHETLWYKLDKDAECKILMEVKKFFAAVHSTKLDVSETVSKIDGEEDTKEPVMAHAQRAQLLSASFLFAKYNNANAQSQASSTGEKLQTVLLCARDYGLCDHRTDAEMSDASKADIAEKLVLALAKKKKPAKKPKLGILFGDSSSSEAEEGDTEQHDVNVDEDTVVTDGVGNNRRQWLDWVTGVSDKDLYSPKINRILTKIRTESRKTEKPRRKIIIFSKFLKLLDLISEAIKRSFKAQPFLFHGALDMDQRESIIRDFSAAEATAQPLLMTQQSGGAALNITAANVVVICEPWWCDNEVKQAVARCLQQGQENSVTISHLMGINSTIDFTVTSARFRKQDEVDWIMAMIRIPDTAELVIPQLPIPSQPIAENSDEKCQEGAGT